MSHNAGKTERGTLWDFSTSILSQNILKIEGGLLGEKKLKKVSQCRRTIEKVEPVVSPGIVCCGEKGNNPFG